MRIHSVMAGINQIYYGGKTIYKVVKDIFKFGEFQALALSGGILVPVGYMLEVGY